MVQQLHDPFNAFCTHVTVTVAGAHDGPLAGLRFAAKDNFDVAGYPTGAGSPDWLRTHGPAEVTAPAVQRMIDAGAMLVGKTQMDELAFSLAGQNAHYGTPINPRTPDRIPGGSSSGSAVATAGGLVDFALGTDTAGSVRVPAHNCGVYGLRPTHGRISLEGVAPFSASFDTAGFFSRDAAMLRRVGEVLLPKQNSSLTLPARTAGCPTATTAGRLLVALDAFALADREVGEALWPLVPRLAAIIGPAEQLQVSPEGLDCWLEQFGTLRSAEVRASMGEWIERTKPQLGPGIRERFGQTSNVTAESVAAARVAREATRRYLDELLRDGNILCLPTAPMIAPLRDSSEAVMVHYRAQTLKMCCIANVGGLPQVSLPIAECGGCPVGMSLIAGRGRDDRLLELAVAIERELKVRG